MIEAFVIWVCGFLAGSVVGCILTLLFTVSNDRSTDRILRDIARPFSLGGALATALLTLLTIWNRPLLAIPAGIITAIFTISYIRLRRKVSKGETCPFLREKTEVATEVNTGKTHKTTEYRCFGRSRWGFKVDSVTLIVCTSSLHVKCPIFQKRGVEK